MSSPKIYALGSCRIHTPLERAKVHSGLSYLPNKAIEFYHNTAEIAQMGGFLGGQRDLMFALCMLLAVKHPLPLFEKRAEDFQFFRDADLYVVEISSVKLCHYRGHQLQLVHLHNFLKAMLDITPETFDSLYKEPALARTIRLQSIESDEQWLAQDILETADFSIQDAAALEADLRRLHMQFGKPVLYVSHFVNAPDGSVFPQRALIRDTLARVVPTFEGAKADVFDPTPLTAAGGYDKNLIDFGHYTEAMELRVSAALAEQARALLR